MLSQIHLLEQLAANAWPPVVTQIVDGWLLRYASGVSRRANSVLTLRETGGATLDERIAEVEAFYARRGLPARFHISPAVSPAGLDQLLAERGYRVDAPTAVQTASLTGVLALAAPSALEVTLAATPSEEWLSIYNSTHADDDAAVQVRRDIMSRVGPPSAFALVCLDGRPAAVGQGVVERGHLGLFSMSTHPDFRRRGAATAILRTLCEWGRIHAAAQVYLQVMDESTEALALYGKLGFRTLYHYHYREALGR
ncbi:MAG: GNAT family N-acetyltransferase [Actinomycetota bacterium]